jgi:hypothetical protein
MPLENGTTETLLLNQIQALQSTVNMNVEELPDSQHKQVLEQILQLSELTNELHQLQLITILAHIRQDNKSVDDDLQEISGYMEQILMIHRTEAENLEKIL